MTTIITPTKIFVKFDGSVVYLYNSNDLSLTDRSILTNQVIADDLPEHYTFVCYDDSSIEIHHIINEAVKKGDVQLDGNKIVFTKEFYATNLSRRMLV